MDNASIIVQNLRAAGLGHWVDAAVEGVDVVCQVAGYQPAPQTVAPKTVALVRAVDANGKNGSSMSPAAIEQLLLRVQRLEAQANAGSTDGSGGHCVGDGLRTLIRTAYMADCGRIPEECLEDAILLSVMLRSWAEVRDDIGIPDLAFTASGLVPTGNAATGQPTTFVPTFNAAPGESMLFVSQAYSIPFNPRCLWGSLAFAGGIDSENYKHVNFKGWAGPRNISTLTTLAGGALHEWAPKRWIYGSEFRCGDGCQEVPLRSYTGCTEIDIIGIDSAFYLQVDNLSTASQAITGQQLVVRLGGFKKPCCDDCGKGKSCSCKR